MWTFFLYVTLMPLSSLILQFLGALDFFMSLYCILVRVDIVILMVLLSLTCSLLNFTLFIYYYPYFFSQLLWTVWNKNIHLPIYFLILICVGIFNMYFQCFCSSLVIIVISDFRKLTVLYKFCKTLFCRVFLDFL